MSQAAEVIGTVVDAEEAAADAAHPATETDGLLTLLLDRHQDVDFPFSGSLDDLIILLLDGLEEAQLVESQDGKIEKTTVEKLLLLQKNSLRMTLSRVVVFPAKSIR